MNDTLGPEGIVPSALAFGEFPSIRTFYGPPDIRPTLTERAEIAHNARKMMASELARTKVRRALNHDVPKSDGVVHQPGNLVYVWCETPSGGKSGEWTEQFKVNTVNGLDRIVAIQDEKGNPKQFNHIQVKPYFLESVKTNYMKSLYAGLSPYMFDRLPKPKTIRLTEVIPTNDPRSESPEMRCAIYDEVQDLIRRGASKIFLKRELPDALMP